MDDRLFAYLQRNCKFVRADQCIVAPSVKAEDKFAVEFDKYDSTDGGQLTLLFQLINLYTRKYHPYIPELESVWNVGNVLYIKTSSTRDMQPLSSVMHNMSPTTLFGLLAEFCTALSLVHRNGLHWGLVHETTLFLSADLKRVYMKGIGYIAEGSAVEDFLTRKARDLTHLKGMIMRIISRIWSIDTTQLQKHLRCENINEVVNELRALAWREAVADVSVLMHWQQALAATVTATHEIKYIPVSLENAFIECLREFIIMLRNDAAVFPVFVPSGCVERGSSAAAPVVRVLFDFFVLNNLLTPLPGNAGLIPSSSLDNGGMENESTKYAYMLLGYLVAYVFVMNIPLQQQLSPLLVTCVMNDSLDDQPRLSHKDRMTLSSTKKQISSMRAGAARLRSLPFFAQLPTGRLFDYFYKCTNNVTISELGSENIFFDASLTGKDQHVVMQWLRSLDQASAVKFTMLLTNTPSVSRNTCRVTLKENVFGHFFISTCDCSMDLPRQWLVDVNTLTLNMQQQLNELTFNVC